MVLQLVSINLPYICWYVSPPSRQLSPLNLRSIELEQPMARCYCLDSFWLPATDNLDTSPAKSCTSLTSVCDCFSRAFNQVNNLWLGIIINFGSLLSDWNYVYSIYLIKCPPWINAQGKSSVFVNNAMYGRGTVGGAELDTVEPVGNMAAQIMSAIEPCSRAMCGVSVTSVGEKNSIEHLLQIKYWIASHFSVCQPCVQHRYKRERDGKRSTCAQSLLCCACLLIRVSPPVTPPTKRESFVQLP